MKDLIQAVVNFVEGYLPENLRPLAGLVEGLVGQLDLPADDSRWQQVSEYVAEVVRDIEGARNLTPSEQMQVRLVAENRFHRQLRELGLIEQG